MRKEPPKVWQRIFDKCYDHLSDQHFKALKDDIYRYIISDEPNQTAFYNAHEKELSVIDVFRRCFRRNMRLYQQQAAMNESLIVDLILEESSEMIKNMVESWIPDLRLSAMISLSGEVYESAHASGQTMVIFPMEDFENQANSMTFHQNNHLPLESGFAHAIRKQLSICGKDSALGITYENNEYKTWGLVPISAQKKYPSFRFVNHLNWEFHLPIIDPNDEKELSTSTLSDKLRDDKPTTRCMVRFCKGSFYFPCLNVESVYYDIANGLFHNDCIAGNIAKLLCNVKAKKGTTIVFSTTKAIKMEQARLAKKYHRGIPFSEDSFYPLVIAKNSNETYFNQDLLEQLSSIDGAILVDTICHCYAFGIILDGKAAKGDPNRGARFNSMCSYITLFKRRHPFTPLLCAVFSEDGMVDLFTNEGHVQ